MLGSADIEFYLKMTNTLKTDIYLRPLRIDSKLWLSASAIKSLCKPKMGLKTPLIAWI